MKIIIILFFICLFLVSSVSAAPPDNNDDIFHRSDLISGCRFDGFDCNDANAGVGSGGC